MGTPRLMALATEGSKVPPAMALRASMGGVSSKSEIEKRLADGDTDGHADDDEDRQQAKVL